MQCPIDGTELVMSDRQGIEIDYCPKCRGVWLDRGELDKIIERSAAPFSQQPTHSSHPPQLGYREERRHDPRYKKKKSLLGEIFDF